MKKEVETDLDLRSANLLAINPSINEDGKVSYTLDFQITYGVYKVTMSADQIKTIRR